MGRWGDEKRNILLGWPNLETGRNGLKSGVSQIIRESWQPCGVQDTYCWKSHHEPLFHSLLIQSSFLHLMPPGKKWKLN